MKKVNLILVCLFCLISSVYSQTEFCSKYDKELILRKTHLVISYNKQDKIPNYVAYELTKDMTIGDANRNKENTFYIDENVPKSYRAYTTNYTNSGYDRGHMSPAADWKYSQDAMHESFVMSNICPQTPRLNRYDWEQVEEIERYMTHFCDTLYVINGTICNTSKYIKNHVRVPDMFFKTLVGVYEGKVVMTEAYLFQNITTKQLYSEHVVTIDDIEKLIGKDLYQGYWFNELNEKENLK